MKLAGVYSLDFFLKNNNFIHWNERVLFEKHHMLSMCTRLAAMITLGLMGNIHFYSQTPLPLYTLGPQISEVKL